MLLIFIYLKSILVMFYMKQENLILVMYFIKKKLIIYVS